MSVDSVLIFARERRDFWSGWSVVAGARETRRKPAQPADCTTEVAEPWRRGARVAKEFVKCQSFFLSLAFDVMKQRKADMAYRSRAHRHPAHSPHTRRPRARPTPAGRKGSDSLGWQQNEYVESWLNNAERNESCPAPKSGSRAPTDHLPH